jgi:hypothetical protein
LAIVPAEGTESTMCFSAEADAIAALVIGAVGVDALRHVATPRQLPLAVLPMVFAAHQLIESLVWWSLEGKVPATVGDHAQWLYLVIAFGVLPGLVPVAVVALEPATRRPLMGVFVCVGAVVSADLMFAVIQGPITATVEGHYIAYEVDLWHGGGLVVLYVLATCGSLLLSAHPHVRVYGAINLVAVLLLAWLNQAAFISVWCVWAAITSVAIVGHLRLMTPGPRTKRLAEVTDGA